MHAQHVGGIWSKKAILSCYDTEILSYFNLCSRDFLWLII